MSLFNWCTHSHIPFSGLHRWSKWYTVSYYNVRECDNCGFKKSREG